jgi:hypothetical protein
LWKYDFGRIFKITCPCLKEIQRCVRLGKYVVLYIRYLQRNTKKGEKYFQYMASRNNTSVPFPAAAALPAVLPMLPLLPLLLPLLPPPPMPRCHR